MIQSMEEHPVNQTMKCEQLDYGNRLGKEWYIMRSTIECDDGFRISIQASSSHYSIPRTKADAYTHVELGFPSEADDLIKPFAEDFDDYTQTVYPYVPAYVVLALLQKHGGIVKGQLPPLQWTHADTMREILTGEYLNGRGEEE